MAMVQNTNRITGLFSGMDTDAVVKAMSMGQQNKVNILNQKKQQAEWKKDILTDFNNKLRIFRETYGSVLGDKSLLARKTFSVFNVKAAENAGVKVTANAEAKAGAYNIRVDQIATASAVKGAKLTGSQTGLTSAEVGGAVGRLSSLANGAIAPGAIEFSINGEDFSFTASDSLKKIMDTVNKSNAGVTMSYSQITDSVTIVSNALGAYDTANPDESKTIVFNDASGFLGHLGLNEVTNGQNAVVYLNGESEARVLDTNTLVLDGMTMNFLRATDAQGVDFTVEADYQPAIDNIKKFIEDFNNLIKELYTAHNQKVNRDYKPLTDEMREAMSEKEIELWEKKAMEGLLYRDNNLGRLLEKMRGVLTKSFGGFGSLASIGITTSKYMIGEPVQLRIDEEKGEEKLLAALAEDADRVFELMSTKDGEGGLMQQFNKMMDDYVATVKSRDIQNLTQSIADYAKSIKEQENKLAAASEKYYLQYAKLETALGQMQAQQEQMASMFGWNNQQ